MIYTNRTLFAALRSVIPNLPEHATEITIRMLAGDNPPTVEATCYAMPSLESEAIAVTCFQRFFVVTEKDWATAKVLLENAAMNEMEIET